MKKIIVLGAGMVGSAMALDLSKSHSVTVADINPVSLARLRERSAKIQLQELDLSSGSAIGKEVLKFDLVIGALPGFLGFNMVKAVIEVGRPIVDISFFPEDALQLNDLAKKNGVTAFVDCGVAPGIPNMVLGRYDQIMKVNNFEYYVGGLPKRRKWPFQYKAPFSPVDVIEEYTRPARQRVGGVMITLPAMSDLEHRIYDQVGTLEAFNTDGLRSLLYTMEHIPNLKEKTLRYPGHIEQIRALQESGFFSDEEIEFQGKKIKPLDFTSQILFKDWRLTPDEEELTIMELIVEGEKDGAALRVSYHLLDYYDPATKISSMARTTGYTATAVANLFLNGLYRDPGIAPPEFVGRNQECFQFVLNYLAERGVNLEH